MFEVFGSRPNVSLLFLLSLQTKVFLILVFSILILLPAMVLWDPLTTLLFAPREMFFCAERVVPSPQMMVLRSPFAILFFPHAIVEFFQNPPFVFPPKIIAFSPSIAFQIPTIIVEFVQVFLISFFFPQMRSALSQLLTLVFASSVLVAENFPSRWMTPC